MVHTQFMDWPSHSPILFYSFSNQIGLSLHLPLIGSHPIPLSSHPLFPKTHTKLSQLSLSPIIRSSSSKHQNNLKEERKKERDKKAHHSNSSSPMAVAISTLHSPLTSPTSSNPPLSSTKKTRSPKILAMAPKKKVLSFSLSSPTFFSNHHFNQSQPPHFSSPSPSPSAGEQIRRQLEEAMVRSRHLLRRQRRGRSRRL